VKIKVVETVLKCSQWDGLAEEYCWGITHRRGGGDIPAEADKVLVLKFGFQLDAIVCINM
jgi:hypothetical protein